ncbi:MAG TPA: mannose-1-phosphate guanylyltransferase [Thermoanaerobaculia bacterium]|nr:mannose-1-phosphate guanylyltransferase [Thermoanaerobaculia bacterium]
MSPQRAIIILAGGAGTRLWPLSTDDEPKQFLRLFGGESLLQRTFARFEKMVDPSRIFVSSNTRYASQITAQLPRLASENLLPEVARKNTGPAVALSTALVAKRFPDVTVGVFPSDHYIGDESAFLLQVESAFQFAEAREFLVTIGIEPTEPNTGFGYLELADSLGERAIGLARFVEKPDRARAEEFLAAGNFLWNGGMFIWRSDYFLQVLSETAPDISALVARILASGSSVERDALYETMPSISIDFAVMEKAPMVATIRGAFEWSDVGSWSAVARLASGQGTANVIRIASDGSYVQSAGTRPIAIVGAEDIAVIDSPEGLLVVRLSQAELVSQVVRELSRPPGQRNSS